MKIKIDEVQLSITNPRFTFLSSFDQDLVEFIKQENDDDYVETKAVKRLLKYEGDLKDFRSLISSILKMGFQDLGESILTVEKNGKYIVAEGNRRVLALKLLSNLAKLPSKDSIFTGVDNVDDSNHDYPSDFVKNYNWLDENISNFIKEGIPVKHILNQEIEIKNVERSEELWRLIYTKHIVGERPGMRKWSRGKYFVDILNFFPNGINLEDEDVNLTLIKNIQREPSIVAKDYYEAQFVKRVFMAYDSNEKEANKKMVNNKVSALQTTFSLKNVRETAKRELSLSSSEFSRLFKINKTNTQVISFETTLDEAEFFKMIFDFYSNKTLTTRPIKAKDYRNFAKRVVNVLNKTIIDPDEELTNDKAKKINAFSFTPDEIEKVLIASPKLPKVTRERFETTKKIMVNDDKINEGLEQIFSSKFLADDPGYVFKALQLQFKHNTNPNVYLHASSATLRSLYEQIVIWGASFSQDVMRKAYPTLSFEEAKAKLANDLAEEQVNSIFKSLVNEVRKPKASKDIINGLAGKEVTDVRPSSALSSLVMKKINEGVHASHRIYNINKYNDYLKMFQSFQDDLFKILEILNEDSIKPLSDKIKAMI